MAYIPTIHTFEDDVNENRGFDEAPISGGVDRYNTGNNILVTERTESSTTKKVLTFIAILFLAASLAVVGYYLYNKWRTNQENARLEAEALANQQMVKNSNEGDLAQILPKLAPGIAPYVESAVQKNNIVILTLKNNDSVVDNYSALYAYILAHKRDLNSDLFYAFKLNQLAESMELEPTNTSLDTTGASTSFSDFTGNSSTTFETNINNSTAENSDKLGSYILKPKSMSPDDIVWESKTLTNQEFEIANAGIITLIYGYATHKYLILTTYLNDFFETIKSLE